MQNFFSTGAGDDGLLPQLTPWLNDTISGLQNMDNSLRSPSVVTSLTQSYIPPSAFGGSGGDVALQSGVPSQYQAPFTQPASAVGTAEEFTPGKYERAETRGEKISGFGQAAGSVINQLEMAKAHAQRAANLRNQMLATRSEYTQQWGAMASNVMKERRVADTYLSAQKASIAATGLAGNSATMQAVTNASSSVFTENLQKKILGARQELANGMYREKALEFEMNQENKKRKGAMFGAALSTVGAVVGGIYGGGLGASAGAKAGALFGNSLAS